jgi:NADPH:quinone reductase-like Zn-dependent oxidoreductase
MKAIVQRAYGSSDVLRLHDIDKPQLKADGVLARVHAASINHGDWLFTTEEEQNLAKSLGAEVTGVCSTRNVDMVGSIGADHVIDYTKENFTQSGQRYDVILDNVEAHSLSECRRVLASQGTYMPNRGTGGRWFGPLGRIAKARMVPSRPTSRSNRLQP